MALAKFVDRVIARLRETPVDLTLLAPEASHGSIFTGGAGIAFFLLEVARLRGEDDLLPLARRWCDAAREWAGHATPPQWNDMPFGVVMGEGGVSYVETLLSAREGDRDRVVAGVNRLDRNSERLLEGTKRPTEFLGGAAGVVCAARDLAARLPAGPSYAAPIETLGRIRDRAIGILLEKYAHPLDPGPHGFLGFAHGIVGELWALVSVLGAEHDLVRARLAELLALRELDEEGLLYWLPSIQSEATFLLGTWCNGMAGHTLLWSEVARQTRTADAMELARLSAESAAILMNGSPSVCCGLAGHSLALKRYSDLSGDQHAGHRAYIRLRKAVAVAEREQASVFLGLWQGSLGIALVALAGLAGQRTIPFLEPLETSPVR